MFSLFLWIMLIIYFSATFQTNNRKTRRPIFYLSSPRNCYFFLSQNKRKNNQRAIKSSFTFRAIQIVCSVLFGRFMHACVSSNSIYKMDVNNFSMHFCSPMHDLLSEWNEKSKCWCFCRLEDDVFSDAVGITNVQTVIFWLIFFSCVRQTAFSYFHKTAHEFGSSQICFIRIVSFPKNQNAHWIQTSHFALWLADSLFQLTFHIFWLSKPRNVNLFCWPFRIRGYLLWWMLCLWCAWIEINAHSTVCTCDAVEEKSLFIFYKLRLWNCF